MLLDLIKYKVIAIIVLCGGVTACSSPPGAIWDENPGGARLQVVSTFSILEDLVENVGGERIALRTLVPRLSDPHTFEPSPADNRTLVGADLIFEIGHDFEPWLDRLYRSSRSTAERVALTGELDLISLDAVGHSHSHGEKDPHVWHDVQNVETMVRAIRDALANADPDNAGTYAENAARYLDALAALDVWILERMDSIPPDRRKLFTYHDVFQYFARRYGLDVAGTALAAATTDTFDPAAAHVAGHIRLIREEKIVALFPERGTHSNILNQLARETDAVVAPPLFTDHLSRIDGEAPTYIEMMRHNVLILAEYLK